MVDRAHSNIRETSTTGGTGNQILAGAFDASYRTFASKYGDGDKGFVIFKQGVSRELSEVTFSVGANSLSRTAVIWSTNSNNLVNFAAGQSIDIFDTLPGPSDLSASQLARIAWLLGGVPRTSTGAALVKEQVAPSTPASGDFSIYAGTDGGLETKNDGGTVRRYGEVVSRTVITNGSPAIDVVLPSGFTSFKLFFERVRMVNDSTFLALRGSFDGTNYFSGSSDYKNGYYAQSNGVLSASAGAGDSSVFLTSTVDNAASGGYSISGEVLIVPGVSADSYPFFQVSMGYIHDTAQNVGQIALSSFLLSAAGTLQSVRIFANSGNLNRGALTLVGFRAP